MIKKRDLPADQFSHTRWSNVNTKETEKLSMCRNLEIEVSRIWEVRTKSVPVVTGGSGIIKKGSDQNFQLLPGQVTCRP